MFRSHHKPNSIIILVVLPFYCYMYVIFLILGMDHMNSLGGTLESIAAHKAGIFKPHTAALMGPGCPFHIMTVSE